jgi:hypothetical protein
MNSDDFYDDFYDDYYENDNNYNDNEEFDEENNPLEDIIERLKFCRLDYYKLYEKHYKVASIRLRQNLEYVIQTAKQMKRDALAFRKEIEKRKKEAIEEAEKQKKAT